MLVRNAFKAALGAVLLAQDAYPQIVTSSLFNTTFANPVYTWNRCSDYNFTVATDYTFGSNQASTISLVASGGTQYPLAAFSVPFKVVLLMLASMNGIRILIYLSRKSAWWSTCLSISRLAPTH